MFDWWQFRRLFGFMPPQKYAIDSTDEKIVKATLAKLQERADARKKAVDSILDQIAQIDAPKKLVQKRAVLRRAQRVCREEEARLRDACHVAVQYGFKPVERYMILWHRVQENAARRAAAKASAKRATA